MNLFDALNDRQTEIEVEEFCQYSLFNNWVTWAFLSKLELIQKFLLRSFNWKKMPPNISSPVVFFVTIHSEKSVLDQSGVIRLWAFCNYKVIKIQIVPDWVKANKIAKILQTSSKYGKSQIFFSLYLTELLPFFLSRWTSTLAELSFFSSFFEPIVSKQSLHLTERLNS